MLILVVAAAILVAVAIFVLIGSMLGGKDKDKNAGSGSQATASQAASGTPADSSAASATSSGEEEGEVRELVNLFNEYYFVADPEGVRELLTADYAGEDNVYAGNGTISNITMEIQSDLSAVKEGDTCTVKVTYQDDEAGEAAQALTLELVKQSDAWRIRSYAKAA